MFRLILPISPCPLRQDYANESEFVASFETWLKLLPRDWRNQDTVNAFESYEIARRESMRQHPSRGQA